MHRAIVVEGNGMIFSDDRTSKDALLNTLGEERAAAWARFYAIEVDSHCGELEYDRALAAPRDWTPRLPRSWQPEDGLRPTGPFELLLRAPAALLLDLSRSQKYEGRLKPPSLPFNAVEGLFLGCL